MKGAEYTGKAIHKGASKLREHIQPEEKPVEVNPTVAKGLHVAKQATGGAVKVSQLLGKNFHLIEYNIFSLNNKNFVKCKLVSLASKLEEVVT